MPFVLWRNPQAIVTPSNPWLSWGKSAICHKIDTVLKNTPTRVNIFKAHICEEMKDPPCRLHSSPVFYLMTRGVYRQFQTHWERKFEAQWLGGFWIVEEKRTNIFLERNLMRHGFHHRHVVQDVVLDAKETRKCLTSCLQCLPPRLMNFNRKKK